MFIEELDIGLIVSRCLLKVWKISFSCRRLNLNSRAGILSDSNSTYSDVFILC